MRGGSFCTLCNIYLDDARGVRECQSIHIIETFVGLVTVVIQLQFRIVSGVRWFDPARARGLG
jgi:hypothetical protein